MLLTRNLFFCRSCSLLLGEPNRHQSKSISCIFHLISKPAARLVLGWKTEMPNTKWTCQIDKNGTNIIKKKYLLSFVFWQKHVLSLLLSKFPTCRCFAQRNNGKHIKLPIEIMNICHNRHRNNNKHLKKFNEAEIEKGHPAREIVGYDNGTHRIITVSFFF